MRNQHKLIYSFEGTDVNLNASPLNITGLQGDTYDYMVETTGQALTSGKIFNTGLRFNNDTTANYRNYEITANDNGGGEKSGNNTESATYIGWLAYATSTGSSTSAAGRAYITGKSGDERYIHMSRQADVPTSPPRIHWVAISDGYWRNTANEITSIQVRSSNALCNVQFRLYQIPKRANLENYDLIEEKTFSSSSTDLTFSGLNGDVDVEYLLEWNADKVANFHYNTDTTTANYTYQKLLNAGTSGAYTPTAGSGTALPLLQFNDFAAIYASTGTERVSTCFGGKINSVYRQLEEVIWYTNTGTNITSIVVGGLVSATGICKLYKRRPANHTIDPVPMKTIAEVPVSGDFSDGVTFSNISGEDLDVIKIEWSGKSTTNGHLKLQFGTSSGIDTATNYENQSIYCRTTVGVLSEYFLDTFILMGYLGINTENAFYLYPKNTGAPKPGLGRQYYKYQNGTDMVLKKFTTWWKNTGDDLTQFKVFFGNTSTVTGTLKVSIPKTNETHCKVTFNKQ